MELTKYMRRCKPLVAAAAMSAFLVATPSIAQVSKKDLQIIGKAVSFIQDGPSGDVMVDIIYDAGNPDSVADADAVAALLAKPLSSGGLKLTGRKVDSYSGAQIVYVSKGVEAKPLNKQGVITVSADPECAISGGCVLGVQSAPKVEIHVSSAASKVAGANFQSSFRMMITEH